jgi:hypothetical protein
MMASCAVWRIPYKVNFAEFTLLILSKKSLRCLQLVLQIVKGRFSTHLSLRTQVEFTLGTLPTPLFEQFPYSLLGEETFARDAPSYFGWQHQWCRAPPYGK